MRLNGGTSTLCLGLTIEKMSVEFKRCSSGAHVTKIAHAGSAGYDVWSADKVILNS